MTELKPEGLIILDFHGTLTNLNLEELERLLDAAVTKSKLIVASGDDNEKRIQEHLASMGLSQEKWPSIIEYASKSTPNFYRELAQQNNVPVNHVILIDDSEKSNIKAFEAGACAIHFYMTNASRRCLSDDVFGPNPCYGRGTDLFTLIHEITSTWNPTAPEARPPAASGAAPTVAG